MIAREFMHNSLSTHLPDGENKKQSSSKKKRRALIKSTLLSVWHYAKPLVGYPIIYIGVGLMAVFYFTGLTNYNFLLFIPMAFITIGIVGRIRALRYK